MSKSKAKQFVNNNWHDDFSYEEEYGLRKTKEEKMRNKRKERRIEHAIRTKNLDELLEIEEDWEE